MQGQPRHLRPLPAQQYALTSRRSFWPQLSRVPPVHLLPQAVAVPAVAGRVLPAPPRAFLTRPMHQALRRRRRRRRRRRLRRPHLHRRPRRRRRAILAQVRSPKLGSTVSHKKVLARAVQVLARAVQVLAQAVLRHRHRRPMPRLPTTMTPMDRTPSLSWLRSMTTMPPSTTLQPRHRHQPRPMPMSGSGTTRFNSRNASSRPRGRRPPPMGPAAVSEHCNEQGGKGRVPRGRGGCWVGSGTQWWPRVAALRRSGGADGTCDYQKSLSFGCKVGLVRAFVVRLRSTGGGI